MKLLIPKRFFTSTFDGEILNEEIWSFQKSFNQVTWKMDIFTFLSVYSFYTYHYIPSNFLFRKSTTKHYSLYYNIFSPVCWMSRFGKHSFEFSLEQFSVQRETSCTVTFDVQTQCLWLGYFKVKVKGLIWTLWEEKLLKVARKISGW